MGAVFNSISAELAPEFEVLLSNDHAKRFLERVCDITGTLMITNSDSQTHLPNSLKICGSWNSIVNAQNILSAYSVVRDVMKNCDDRGDIDVMRKTLPQDSTIRFAPESKRNDVMRKTLPQDSTINYAPESKRKRKSQTPMHIKKMYNYYPNFEQDKLTESISSMLMRKFVKGKTNESKSPSTNFTGMLEKNSDSTNSPVPVFLSSIESSPSFPVVPPPNPDGIGHTLSCDGQDIHIMPKTEANDMFHNMKTESNTNEGEKDQFKCTLCKYSTNTARNLEAHLDRFHLKPVTCHICGKGFGYERDLKRHLLKNKYSCHKRSVINQHYINALQSNPYSETAKQETKENENDSTKHKSDTPRENLVKVKEEPQDMDDTSFDGDRHMLNNSTFSHDPDDTCSSTDISSLEVTQAKITEKKSIIDLKIEEIQNSEHSEVTSDQQEMRAMYAEGQFDDYSNDYTAKQASGESISYFCHFCTYAAQKKQHMIDHICRMHKKQFACEHCNSMFGLIKDLNRHLRRSHGIDIPLKNSRGVVVHQLIP